MPGAGAQRPRSEPLVRPLRNPPSLLVECWSPLSVFGSTIGAGAAGEVAERRAGAEDRARVAAAFGLAAPVRALAVDLRAVPDRAADDRAVPALAVPLRAVDPRAADAFGLAAGVLRAVLADRVPDAVLRAVVLLAAPVRAEAADLVRLAADVDVLRVVPDLAAVLRVPVVLRAVVPRAVVARVPVRAVPVRAVEDFAALAVVVMTFAAASIALAASVIALVAVVIALVIAVMALAEVDALVATDFICVAAALAWLAALVTRVAAVVDVRLDAALVRAEPAAGLRAAVVLLRAVVVRVPVRLDDARADVLRDEADRADDVRLAAGFLAAVDFFAAVLFVRLAVPRLDAVRDAVLIGTDLPPVMISFTGRSIPRLVTLYTR